MIVKPSGKKRSAKVPTLRHSDPKLVSRRAVLGASCGCTCVAVAAFAPATPGLAMLVRAESGPLPSIDDAMAVLPPGAVRLSGFLDDYIRLSIQAWSKGVVPYRELADIYRHGRPYVDYLGKQVVLFAAGELWGKAVRCAALFYRYTGDPKLKAILRATVADILSTRRSNGTISCSPVEKQPDGPMGDIWERKYVLLALEDYYSFVEADPKVLQAMIDEADATLQQVGPGPGQISIVDLGWSINHIESSAILEPIVRLYNLTGYERYLAFARYIVEVGGGALHHRIFDEVLSGQPPMDLGGVYPKAYEMTSVFEGLAEYYRAAGNERWQAACQRYFHGVIEHEITIIGNGGGDMPYHPNLEGEAWDNTAYEQTNPAVHRMMETCAGVTWMKFCHQILRLTGDPAAADYVELYAYNGLIGAMAPTGDGFGYVNLLNGVKTNQQGWGATIAGVHVTCCNSNGPIGLAYLPMIAVMESKSGPVINLYNAGTADTSHAHLRIVTRYPLDGRVRIEVSPKGRGPFTLKLRIPAWSEDTHMTLNGETIEARPGTYSKISRPWRMGDVIEIDFDFRTRAINARPGLHHRYTAIMRGPLVFTRDASMDPSFAAPVDVVADGASYVLATPIVPPEAGRHVELSVPTTQGTIRMVDYASAGKTGEQRVATWLAWTDLRSE